METGANRAIHLGIERQDPMKNNSQVFGSCHWDRKRAADFRPPGGRPDWGLKAEDQNFGFLRINFKGVDLHPAYYAGHTYIKPLSNQLQIIRDGYNDLCVIRIGEDLEAKGSHQWSQGGQIKIKKSGAKRGALGDPTRKTEGLGFEPAVTDDIGSVMHKREEKL